MASLLAKSKLYTHMKKDKLREVDENHDLENTIGRDNISLLHLYHNNRYPSHLERHAAFDYPAIEYNGRLINRDRNGHWWIDDKLNPKYKGLSIERFEELQKQAQNAYFDQLSMTLRHSGLQHDHKEMNKNYHMMMTREIITPQWQLNHGKFDGPSISHNGQQLNMDRNQQYWIDGKLDEHSQTIMLPPQQFYRLQANRNPEFKQKKVAACLKQSCLK